MRANVAAIRVGALADDTDPLTITLSIGIAEIRREPGDENVERVVQRADEAMYKAKQSGRNRIVIFRKEQSDA
ncbi:MAG: diguanylate cyclase [Anaerolineales bacterium]|nr:diguanylate cyclase [Anaerolineales bacterium]